MAWLYVARGRSARIDSGASLGLARSRDVQDSVRALVAGVINKFVQASSKVRHSHGAAMSRRPAGTPGGQPASKGRLEAVLAAGLAHHAQQHSAPTDAGEKRDRDDTLPPTEPPKRLRKQMPQNIFSILPYELLQIILFYSKGMPCEEIAKLREIDSGFKGLLKNEVFWQWQCELRDYDRESRLFASKNAQRYWDPPTAPPGQAKVPYSESWRYHYEYWCQRQLRDVRDYQWDDWVTLHVAVGLPSFPIHPDLGPVGEWDVSQCTNMANLFDDTTTRNFERDGFDISKWDVSNARTMRRMFAGIPDHGARINVSDWDVSNVEDMNAMFFKVEDFNSDLSKWKNKVSKVKDMAGMFAGCRKFNSDLSGWKVGNVQNMANMFTSCLQFNSDLSNWDVSNVRSMHYMFAFEDFDGDMTDEEREGTIFNGNLSKWKVGKVREMQGMFKGNKRFNNGSARGVGLKGWNNDLQRWNGLEGWDVGEVEEMSGMFEGAESFNCNLAGWNVMSVNTMGAMFANATTFNCGQAPGVRHDLLATWNVMNVMEMISMFAGATSFNGNLSTWTLSELAAMSLDYSEGTFFNATSYNPAEGEGVGEQATARDKERALAMVNAHKWVINARDQVAAANFRLGTFSLDPHP